ncbi:hypothetical protein [Paenibacillus sp. MMO-177]|uniref:hypothetical protein n=1 Tax=Paenibacillus sp. MMO-177 TaxID=3081289 RepID=UPI003015FE82
MPRTVTKPTNIFIATVNLNQGENLNLKERTTMKKAAMIAVTTCLFLSVSAATASASAVEPTATKKVEHKMHVKEHKEHKVKAKEHKMHAKQHKAKAHELRAKSESKAHKLHAKSKLRAKALPKTGYGGVSE